MYYILVHLTGPGSSMVSQFPMAFRKSLLSDVDPSCDSLGGNWEIYPQGLSQVRCWGHQKSKGRVIFWPTNIC